MQYCLLLLVFCVIASTFSYKILVIVPYPSKSHFITFKRLFVGLAEKGHNVTVLSYYSLDKSIHNYRSIKFGGLEMFYSKEKINSILNIKHLTSNRKYLTYLMPLLIEESSQLSCDNGLNSTSVRNFLKEKNHFDLAIVQYFDSDCFLPLAKTFNAPIIRIHTCSLMAWSSDRYGNPNNPAYIPNNLLAFSDKMTFFERVENTLVTFVHDLYINVIAIKKDRTISMKYFGELSNTLHTDILNDSLLLVTTHYTFNLPRPLVPNVIEIGGIHIEKPQPMPQVRNGIKNKKGIVIKIGYTM